MSLRNAFAAMAVAAGAISTPAFSGPKFDLAVNEVKTELAELDQTRYALTQILDSVIVDRERPVVRLQWFNNHELKTGTYTWQLKPEQPVVDHFVDAWVAKNHYVPLQMQQLLIYLRMPVGSDATSLMTKAGHNLRELERRLISAKKADGDYNESTDTSIINAVVASVESQQSEKADAQQYFDDQELLDKLLDLREKYWTRPIELSKRVLAVADEGQYTNKQLRKFLFFIPVKKYFWQMVAKVEETGEPINWIMSKSWMNEHAELYSMLMDLVGESKNRPVLLSQKIWAYVEKNKEVLTSDQLELCGHFTPNDVYSQRIFNLVNRKGGFTSLAGFTPNMREVRTLSTQNVTRFISLGGALKGMFVRNPKGSPSKDMYRDINGVLNVLRQDNSQGGERWLTPYTSLETLGDNGAFVFNYFDAAGRPLGFARRSLISQMLYFYDLEANLIGASKPILGEIGTETLYGGRFYFLTPKF